MSTQNEMKYAKIRTRARLNIEDPTWLNKDVCTQSRTENEC